MKAGELRRLLRHLIPDWHDESELDLNPEQERLPDAGSAPVQTARPMSEVL